MAAAKSSGQPVPVRLGGPLYSLAASMPMVISLAHECGQAAAGAEAERVLGRTLRLLAVRGGRMAGAVAGGARIVGVQQGRQPRTAGCLELFAAVQLPPWLVASAYRMKAQQTSVSGCRSCPVRRSSLWPAGTWCSKFARECCRLGRWTSLHHGRRGSQPSACGCRSSSWRRSASMWHRTGSCCRRATGASCSRRLTSGATSEARHCLRSWRQPECPSLPVHTCTMLKML